SDRRTVCLCVVFPLLTEAARCASKSAPELLEFPGSAGQRFLGSPQAPDVDPLHATAPPQEEGGAGPVLQRADHRAGEEVRDAEVPIPPERKRLAKMLQLSERQVKTWFQNRRENPQGVKREVEDEGSAGRSKGDETSDSCGIQSPEQRLTAPASELQAARCGQLDSDVSEDTDQELDIEDDGFTLNH
ncbi:hypothetical protein KUCAC02_000066, partial [Chaenocephalus aceratus]